MINVFVVMGKSGAGKDTLFRALISDKSLNLNPVILYTDRPMRPGEVEGIDYYFLSPMEFSSKLLNCEFDEYREYSTAQGMWHYGTSLNSLEDGKNYILVNSPNAVQTLMLKTSNNFKFHLIYVDVCGYLRLMRSATRVAGKAVLDDSIVSEICRRYLEDDKDFGNVEKRFDVVKVDNNADINRAINEATKFIRGIIND